MSDFLHNFSASASRARVIDTCARRFYLKTYAGWEGWYRGARHNDPTARLAYILSKAKGLGGLVGDVVHGIAADLVRAACDQMPDLGVEADTARAVRRFDEVVADAKSKRWERQSPKAYPMVVEIYYGHRTLDAKIAENRAKVERCIAGLYASPYFSRVRLGLRAGALKLLAADDRKDHLVVSVDGQPVPVTVMMDLALLAQPKEGPERWNVGELKSGRVYDADEKQVGLYVWALGLLFGATPDRVTATTVYVGEDKETRTQATEAMAYAGLDFVTDSVRKVRSHLVDGDLKRNEPLPAEAWEMLPEGASACRYCDQRALCPRFQSKQEAA